MTENPMIIKHRTKEKYELDVYRGHCLISKLTLSNKYNVQTIPISDKFADELKEKLKEKNIDFLTLYFIEIMYQKDIDIYCMRLIRNNKIEFGIALEKPVYYKIKHKLCM